MPFERWLYAWRARWRALFDRGRADRELDDELRDHVARETAALRARGVSPADARRQALASLGGLASAQDRVRAVRFGALAEQVLQDVRHGLRLLVRNPGFTAATVVTLTVGSGQRPAFSRSSTPFSSSRRRSPEPGRLVPLWETDPTDGDRATEVAPANFLDWRAQATSFEEVAAIVPYSFDATGAGEPEVLSRRWSPKASSARGRTFRPDEYRAGSGGGVLTDGFWQRRYGGDLAVVGESLVLEGVPHTVVGSWHRTSSSPWNGGRMLRPATSMRPRPSRSGRRSGAAAAGGRSWPGSVRRRRSIPRGPRCTPWRPASPPTIRAPTRASGRASSGSSRGRWRTCARRCSCSKASSCSSC